MISPDGTAVAFQEPPGVEALSFWVDLINTHQVMPLLGWTQAQQSWNGAKIAQLFTTTALWTALSTGVAFQVSALPFPKHPDMVPWHNFPGRGGTRIYKLVQDAIQDASLAKKTPKVALDEAAEAANRLIRGRS
jgi:ABC-type glycerol-3-phosphate transport system substrate-binding protein